MAIEPVRIHLPFEVTAGADTEFVLEDYLNVSALHDPILLFWNTSAESIDIQVEFILDFGISGNPLETGTFTDDLVATTTVATGDRLPIDVQENVEVLLNATDTAPITHNITLTNNSASDIVVRFLLSGFYEDILHEAKNEFVRRQGLL